MVSGGSVASCLLAIVNASAHPIRKPQELRVLISDTIYIVTIVIKKNSKTNGVLDMSHHKFQFIRENVRIHMRAMSIPVLGVKL